jgi:hypothetical protein
MSAFAPLEPDPFQCCDNVDEIMFIVYDLEGEEGLQELLQMCIVNHQLDRNRSFVVARRTAPASTVTPGDSDLGRRVALRETGREQAGIFLVAGTKPTGLAS